MDERYKNHPWKLNGQISVEGASLCVLMDIRDELQAINSKLGCWRIPLALGAVMNLDKRMAHKNPLRPRRKKKVA